MLMKAQEGVQGGTLAGGSPFFALARVRLHLACILYHLLRDTPFLLPLPKEMGSKRQQGVQFSAKKKAHTQRRKKEKGPQICDPFFWWGRVDSNHRRHCQQIYSLSPLATREHPRVRFTQRGAGGRTRTPDLLITNQLLYRLSYTSAIPATAIITKPDPFVNKKLPQRPTFFAQATVPALSEYFS